MCGIVWILDASGSGFGLTLKLEQGLRYRYVVLGSDEDGASSNFRDLKNLVKLLEERENRKLLSYAEVFVFTDNFTAKSVFYKGNSSIKWLFELVLRLRLLEMEGSIKLSVIHVSDK